MRRSCSIPALLALLVALPVVAQTPADECTSPGSGWIFCTGFEEGNLDLWDDYDGNPQPTNTILADPGPLDEPGNHVMRLYVPQDAQSADLVKLLPSRHAKLYARWYAYWEDGYDFGAANHGSGLHAGARELMARSGYQPDGTDRYNAYVDHWPAEHRLVLYSYYRGMYQDCADPDGACWGDRFPCMFDEGQGYCTNPDHRETTPTPVMQTGRWYCVEIMVDGGTPTDDPARADGALDLWIDGVEYGPWTDLWMRTTADLELSILWLNLFFHGAHADAGVRIDHVVVSTEPIGPVGTLTGIDDDGAPPSWSAVKKVFD
ncbi:MAG: hypothetical protein R3D98_14885 [Candidatus Krumholzibacteriia bacterium]